MKCKFCGEEMEYIKSYGGYEEPLTTEYKCSHCGASVEVDYCSACWEVGEIKEELIVKEIEEAINQVNKELDYQHINYKFCDEGVEIELSHREWTRPNVNYIKFEDIRNIEDFKTDYLVCDVRG